MKIEEFEAIQPTEQNGYCVFEPALEDDDSVFFHATFPDNVDSIAERGFLSAKGLAKGERDFVSFSRRSSACFAHLGTRGDGGIAVFAVRFEDGHLEQVKEDSSGIHVFDPQLQPDILGYVRIKTPPPLP